MTDAERREIKAKHFPAGIWGCRKCGLTPADAQCEAQELLAEVERLRGVVAKLEGFIETSAGKATSVGGAGVYPCPKDGTVLALLQGGAWCPVCHTVWRQTDEVALAKLEAKP